MALLFTVLLGVSASILGYFLYDFGKQDFVRETEAVLNAEIASMIASTDPQNPDTVIAYVEQKAAVSSLNFFRYEDINGRFLAGNMETLPAHIDRIAEGILRFSLEVGDDRLNLAVKIYTFPDGSRVMVARNIDSIIKSYERLQQFSVLIMVLMSTVVMVSFAISYFVVSRINTIAETAREIMETGDLSRRISVDTQWDDLSNLAQVLNSFLARIEVLMDGIREVSNNIAHDLRTPLTHLRNQIEELKLRPPAEPDVDKLLVEADQILAIFHSLLRISNLEKGKRYQSFEEIDLVALLRDVVEFYEPVAEEKNIQLTRLWPDSHTISGDRHLLFQLFANVLDNAIKFSPHGGQVAVQISAEKTGWCITIDDHGPGIVAAEKDRVFQRFYRGDASRSTEGNGLGLSLAKAIVDLHHGSICLEDNAPGLRVRIVLEP